MLEDLRKVYYNPQSVKPGTHTVYLKNWSELMKLLSPKRLEMLSHIANGKWGDESVSEMSHALKRKQEAISRDAKILEKHGMVKKVKQKQMVYLKSMFDSIQIKFG